MYKDLVYTIYMNKLELTKHVRSLKDTFSKMCLEKDFTDERIADMSQKLDELENYIADNGDSDNMKELAKLVNDLESHSNYARQAEQRYMDSLKSITKNIQ